MNCVTCKRPMEAAGKSCTKPSAAPAALKTVAAPQYTDPIVRRRLGLPPLN